MSKRKRINGSSTIENRLAEGRGEGRGRDYKPWLMIHDVASRGLASRVKSPLNGRTYHLLSQLETDWLYAFHGLPELTDIREQYPLLELSETLEIADRLGIAHPTDPRTKESCVVTTDFLLTLIDGLRHVDMAIAVKPSTDLASERTLEKLEIERTYWSARNTNWRILTEKELPRALVKNMRWLWPYIEGQEQGALQAEELTRIRLDIEPEVRQAKRSLVEVTMDGDKRLGLKPGSALCVARHLIATAAWPIDLTTEINPRQPLQLLQKGVPNALARVLPN